MADSRRNKQNRKRKREFMADSQRNRKRKTAFNTIFPDIQSPQGMKSPALKNVYSFLVQLCSNAEWSINNAVDSHSFDIEICHGDITVTFEDISELANVMFKELEERFEHLFSKLGGISADEDLVESSSSLGLFDAMEVLNLLFRCCMLLIMLLEARLNLILEKGQILLRILGKLFSPNLVKDTRGNAFVFEKSFFHECTPVDNGCSASSVEGFTASLQFLEPYDPLLVFKTTMLEVFVDELLAHRQLTGYFMIINSAAGIDERLFIPRSVLCGTGIVIEAICNHFILSFSDKKALLSQLFFMHAIKLNNPYRAPELGVNAAVSLLLNPIMVSAPKYVQAHLISLVSEAVHIDVKSVKPDRKLSNCFLSSFEKSVCLYRTHMSRLETDGYSVLHGGCTSSSPRDIVSPPFESYISPDTKNKIDTLISRLDNSSNQDPCDSFFRMKSDLVSSSMRFVKECQSVYDISCPEEIFAIVSYLILKASESYDENAMLPTEATTLQHLYPLASILKLMSISLLQAIQCLRHSDDSRSPKTLKGFTSCKEYNFIINTITCFRDLDISLPLQEVLSSQMSSHSMRHVDSKMMFLHFSGLMSLSFVSGLECLVKACLLSILAVLNLFVFEEGDLDALQSLVDSNKESSSPESPVVIVQETVVDRNNSLVVASKFHKIRSRLLSAIDNKHNGGSASNMEAAECLEEETEETINGEIFLKCMLKMDDVSKFDDLVDFVECEQGKDYSSWLKNRQRYRKRKSEKLAVLRWEKKKKTWRSLKGNRID
ncbi:hypothetical protein ACS0TY_027998 [Phlomoides rotata]